MSDKSSPSEDLSEPTEEETGDSTEEDLSEHTEKTDAKDPDWVPSKYFKALLTPKTTSFLNNPNYNPEAYPGGASGTSESTPLRALGVRYSKRATSTPISFELSTASTSSAVQEPLSPVSSL